MMNERDPGPEKNKTNEILNHTKLLCKFMNLMGNTSKLDDQFRDINDTHEFCKTLDDLEIPDFELTTDEMIKNGVIYSAYAFIVIVSLIGNLMVVWAIFSKKRMRTTVNIFIGNLATSDIMMTVCNIPFSSARLLMDNWIFGDFMCRAAPFLQVVAVYVSTITMAYIAVDRYQAIMSPMGWRISTSLGTKWGLVLIWTVSTILSLPYVIFSKTVDMIGIDRVFKRCRMDWPEPAGTMSRTVNVATFVCQFAVPFVLLSVLYAIIGLKIWSRETIGATTIEQQNRQVIAKRRTIVMLLLVAIVFAVCWLPLNLYYLLEDFAQYHNQNMKITFHWLAMSSVCYNPFIYFCLNRRFKQVLKSITCCINCDSVSSPMSLPPSNNHQNFLVNVSRIIFGSRQADLSNDLTSGNRSGNERGKVRSGLFEDEADNSNSSRIMNNLRNIDQSAVLRSSGSNNSTVLTMNNNATPSNATRTKINESNLCVQTSSIHHQSSGSTDKISTSCRIVPPVNTEIELNTIDPDDEPVTAVEHFCLNRIPDPDKYDLMLCESSFQNYRNTSKSPRRTSMNKKKDYDMSVRAARFVDSSSF